MEIRELKKEEYDIYVSGVQDAFQKGYEAYFGKCDDIIIPKRDIDESYNCEGSKTYVAVLDNKIVGGATVVINSNNINDLHILYVDKTCQSKGLGYRLWEYIENEFKDTIMWKTCTPYFDERNIHFYVNKCGFHIVEFLCKYHNPVSDIEEDFIGDHGEGMFEFEKVMKK